MQLRKSSKLIWGLVQKAQTLTRDPHVLTLYGMNKCCAGQIGSYATNMINTEHRMLHQIVSQAKTYREMQEEKAQSVDRSIPLPSFNQKNRHFTLNLVIASSIINNE